MNILSAVTEIWWSLVFHASWQTAAVAAVLLGVVWGMRKLPAPLRYGLLLVALVKFAIPPVFGVHIEYISAGAPQTAVAPASGLAADVARHGVAPTSVGEQSAQAARGAARFSNSTAPSPTDTVATTDAAAATDAVATTDAVAATDVPASTDASPRRPLFSWRLGLLLAHACGMLAVLSVLLYSFLHVSRFTRQCRLVDSGPVRERFDHLRARLGMRDNVELLVAPGDLSPMAIGVFRRRIFVPERLLDNLNTKQIDVILSHELAHHRRRDTWCIALENILLTVWWFNPLFWVVLRSLRSVREDCCDDLLLETGVADDDTYCDSLLRAAAMIRRPRMARAALGFADRFHPLGRRLQRIMDISIQRRTRLSVASVAGLVLLALCVWPGVRLVRAQPSEEETAWIEQNFDAPIPAILEQAPGELAFEGLYRHREAGEVVETPEHRWVKWQEDGTVAVASHLPFLETVFYAEGGRLTGLTRYEFETSGGSPYSVAMQFETGKVLVTQQGLDVNWDQKEFAVPARALFDPNSEPDPYCAAQIIQIVLSIPAGTSEETHVYDWDSTGENFAYYRIRITNLGPEEVTVPCGDFMANHLVIEQTTDPDLRPFWLGGEGQTAFKKSTGDMTDMWLLDDGTILRVLRSRGPYEVDLLDWKTPETLPGLIQRYAPQMYEDSSAVPTPPPPVTAQHVPMAGFEQYYDSWTSRGFRMPFRAAVYLTPIRGEADGVSELGIGSNNQVCQMILRQLPENPEPAGETFIGEYEEGYVIPFCLKTTWQGQAQWVSTSEDTYASRVSFQDTDGSLGGQPAVQQIGPDRWMMNLDDANSYEYDDDDNDIPIVIRLEKI